MTGTIVKLKAEDYDELLDALNVSFEKDQDNSFDLILPAMWRRADEDMAKHVAIKDGNKVAAVVGIYPLPVRFAGHDLLFATVGNVATRHEYRGRDYMKRLMLAAMDELKALNVHVARLGGQRQRYNRFGFDHAAQQLTYRISQKNVSSFYDGKLAPAGAYTPRLVFRDFANTDEQAVDFAQNLQQSALMYVKRGDRQRFYDTLTAWRMRPILATEQDGTPVGFMSVSADGSTVAEHSAISPELDYQMLLDWLVHTGHYSITCQNAPWQTQLNRKLLAMADTLTVTNPTMFKIINWLPVIKAMLDAKASFSTLPHGHFTLHINGYATLDFTDGTVAVTDEAPMLTLNRLEATQLICGNLKPTMVFHIPDQAKGYVDALFPLPIWWNNQDRV